MVAPVNSQSPERKLLDRAIATLIAALAADEAQQCGASDNDVVNLRRAWVKDAEAVIEGAEALGLLDRDGDA